MPDQQLKICILDMQPIDPPTGGGRLRLFGLYHDLGDGMEAQYVGSYDWRGPGPRRQQLTPTLEESLVPLSASHFKAAKGLSRAAEGQTVIDSAFAALAHLSLEFVAAATESARSADIVIFSHPWIYPIVRASLDRTRQMVVYDAHNFEGLLRLNLLGGSAEGARIARDVVRDEAGLCLEADLILASSHGDRSDFIEFYGVAPERTRVVPNGTFTKAIAPANPTRKQEVRRSLDLDDQPVTLFLGSNYGPNLEAAEFIVSALAPQLPDVQFVLVGGVGESRSSGKNVLCTGVVSEAAKHAWLEAADIGVNPMFSGSGTNIKMFDYMAAGLAVVSSPTGARGIHLDGENIVVAHPGDMARAISNLVRNRARTEGAGAAARQWVERCYSWERLSSNLGQLLKRSWRTRRAARPYFSVIIPSFERSESLTALVEGLVAQTCRDFEVIIVDQSPSPWPDRDRDFGLDVLYVHTDLRGAVHARNRGADLASGRVFAFIDDDCRPTVEWLASAREAFSKSDIVGLEGLITCDDVDPNVWRRVTNEGFEGIGFMTANLFVRADIFHRVDGFDVVFDHPHFREDTDMGWRIQKLGATPFSRSAAVYHPPQPRSELRESSIARAMYFEKDALLLKKHPQKYVELFRREKQWKQNPQFWTYFVNGLRRYQVEAPDAIRRLIPQRLNQDFPGGR